MKHNQLGFNNFKSFGDRIQMFSDKPITLVYGANSVGKSSFLHAQLLLDYLVETGNINFESSDFAGDRLDLGGWKNYIHKKDPTKRIKYKYEINDAEVIASFLGAPYLKAKYFSKNNVIDKCLKLSKEELTERLKTYRVKENYYLIPENLYYDFEELIRLKELAEVMYGIDGVQQQKDTIKDNFFVLNDRLLPIDNKERNKIFLEALSNPKPFIETIELVNGAVFDDTDICILFIIELKILFSFLNKKEDDPFNYDSLILNLQDGLKSFFHLSKIDSINLTFESFINKRRGRGVRSDLKLYVSIDNDIIFEAIHVKKGFYKIKLCKKGSSFLSEFISKEQIEDISSEIDIKGALGDNFGFGILNKTYSTVLKSFGMGDLDSLGKDEYKAGLIGDLSVHDFICEFLDNVGSFIENHQFSTIQYFSPLRFYPKRSDMTSSKDQEIRFEKTKNTKSHERVWNEEKYNNIVEIFRLMKKFERATDRIFQPATARKLFGIYLMFKNPIGPIISHIFSGAAIRDHMNFFRSITKTKSGGLALRTERIWAALIHSKALQNDVNSWLSDKTKLSSPYRVDTKNDSLRDTSLYFVDTNYDVEVTPREMGLGISQFLPILLASKVLEKSKIYIEQPELHLHPSLQCEVADEFIRSKNAQGNKFIIESHSEHLLLRVMKRLRHSSEGKLKKGDDLYLTPDDICLLYVDNNGEFTYLNELELDDDGALLDPWPNGFFEEGLDEMFT